MPITRSDLYCLTGNYKLNDNMIEHYMNVTMISARNKYYGQSITVKKDANPDRAKVLNFS